MGRNLAATYDKAAWLVIASGNAGVTFKWMKMPPEPAKTERRMGMNFEDWWDEKREKYAKEYAMLGHFAIQNIALCAWNASSSNTIIALEEIKIRQERIAELEAALAEKEKELADLLEKVRRWDTANEKIKMMVKKDYYVDDMQTAKDELFKAENALRAAVEKKLANISKCPDCGREKAKDAVESAMGFCPKWWAIHDHDAHEDCRRTAVGQ